MMQSGPEQGLLKQAGSAVEVTLRVGLVLLLLYWCFDLLRPFLALLLWGAIIAVAAYPLYGHLKSFLGNRRVLAAIVFTVLGYLILLSPIVMLGGSFLFNAGDMVAALKQGTLNIPAPPERLAGIPLVGEPLDAFWHLARENLSAALQQIRPQLKELGKKLLEAGAGTGLAVIQFSLSLLVAGALLAFDRDCLAGLRALMLRLAGPRGEELTLLAGDITRSVARGIIGVAFIQSLLAGMGFLAAGVPAAGLWAIICLVLCIVQLGAGFILFPVSVYVFYHSGTLPGILFLAWSVFVVVVDNLLKPLLLGRGVRIPMLVVFLGSIGGLIQSGIIGLFTGAVLLALGYEMARVWLFGSEELSRNLAVVKPDGSES